METEEEKKEKKRKWTGRIIFFSILVALVTTAEIIDKVRLIKKSQEIKGENEKLQRENSELRGENRALERENRRVGRENLNLTYQLGKKEAEKHNAH
jgi:cell division protein FtsB